MEKFTKQGNKIIFESTGKDKISIDKKTANKWLEAARAELLAMEAYKNIYMMGGQEVFDEFKEYLINRNNQLTNIL